MLSGDWRPWKSTTLGPSSGRIGLMCAVPPSASTTSASQAPGYPGGTGPGAMIVGSSTVPRGYGWRVRRRRWSVVTSGAIASALRARPSDPAIRRARARRDSRRARPAYPAHPDHDEQEHDPLERTASIAGIAGRGAPSWVRGSCPAPAGAHRRSTGRRRDRPPAAGPPPGRSRPDASGHRRPDRGAGGDDREGRHEQDGDADRGAPVLRAAAQRSPGPDQAGGW